MQPSISIIVPVYKAEEYLHRCVDSILAQTFTDFELILIDDGSPDNSGSICDEYARKDTRIKVIHKANGGVGSARNAGLDVAIGKWIIFVDSDDYLKQGFLINPCDVEEDLVVLSYEVFGDNCRIHKNINSTITKSEIKQHLNNNIHKQIFRVPWAKIFKTSIITKNNIRYQTDTNIGEDTLFVFDYLVHTGSIRYIDSPAYMYRDNSDFSRYGLTAEKAVYFFHKFIDSYKRLNAESINFLNFAFTFYWRLIIPNIGRRYAKTWYNDHIVNDIYKTIKKHMLFRDRLIYYIYSSLPYKLALITDNVYKALIKALITLKNIKRKFVY